jgi:hypothetical protein
MEPLNNIFKDFVIPIPSIVHSYDDIKQKEIYEYLTYLMNDEQQKKAYVIAYQHLGSSFNIYKSNGFKEWKATIQSKSKE